MCPPRSGESTTEGLEATACKLAAAKISGGGAAGNVHMRVKSCIKSWRCHTSADLNSLMENSSRFGRPGKAVLRNARGCRLWKAFGVAIRAVLVSRSGEEN